MSSMSKVFLAVSAFGISGLASAYDCQVAGYYGGYNVQVTSLGSERDVELTLERFRGWDGDGESAGPYVLEGEKVAGECDLFDFKGGYLKVCDGVGELVSVLKGFEPEVLGLECK